jgi:sugar/nucleoside kinase (ribokinase family)
MNANGEKGRASADYLIIGHVVRDVVPVGGFTAGGTATYAGRTALAMGCRVRIVTSTGPDLNLDKTLAGCEITRVPARQSTTMENIYTATGRQQRLHSRAADLDLSAVPEHWRHPDVVHLGPLVGESDPELVSAFPDALVCMTLQGWMRTWDESGRVRFSDWPEAEDVLPRVDAAVLSLEDVGGDETIIERFAQLAPLLVVTLGAAGCRVYAQGEVRQVPVTRISEADPTGAGDIFAAAFFVRLYQTGDPWSAAKLANRVAAVSVTRLGWTATPTREEVAYLMRNVRDA